MVNVQGRPFYRIDEPVLQIGGHEVVNHPRIEKLVVEDRDIVDENHIDVVNARLLLQPDFSRSSGIVMSLTSTRISYFF